MLWVVYQMKVHGKDTTSKAVCEQGEWDAMQQKQPGYHTLVQEGIATESEAERLARLTPEGRPAGDRAVRRPETM